MWGPYDSRYVHDSDGMVHDSMVEYCIDFVCGVDILPEFFHFAINRVFKEYLHGLNDPEDDIPYLPVFIKHHEHVGFHFKEPHNFMEERWSNQLTRVYFRIDSEMTYYATTMKKPKLPALSSGPVGLIGDDQEDLTFVLACLLLCREIAQHKLTARFKSSNNHKGSSHGKDQATL